MTATPYKEAAFKYLTHGWRGPLPVGERPKLKDYPPTGYTGNDGAWPDEDQIAEWVRDRPNVNIAIRLPLEVVGLDVDDYGNKPGAETMIATTERHGKLPRTWISTARTGTRSGIRWFQLPDPQPLSVGRLAHPDNPEISGVDIIRFGYRYALVPPSLHPEGGQYRWVKPDGTTPDNGQIPKPQDLAVLPPSWVDHIRQDCSCWASFQWDKYTEQQNDPVRAAYEKWAGRITEAYGRHEGALGGAMALVAFKERGWPGADQCLQQLETDFYNSLGDSRSESKAEAEWQRMIEGAEKKAATTTIPQYQERKPSPTRSQGRRLRLSSAATIKPRPVWWHWQDRIPVGEITLTPGLGGVGKSTFHAWVIAQTTRGTLPGINYGKPRSAIICAAEDSWSRSIVPRLMAADADLERVYRADVVSDEGIELRLTLPADVEALTEEVVAYDVAVISLDPLLSTIDGEIDSHKAHEVRAALEPLRAVADETDAVLLGNAHFNKATGTDPLQRITGSAAFGEVCRAAIAFAKDDDSGTFVLSQAKNNLGRLDLPSLTYALMPATIPTDEGPSEVGRFTITGESTRNVKDILSWHIDQDKSERDFARGIILTALQDGPMPWKKLTDTLKREGISEATGRRARTELKNEELIDFTGGGQSAYQWTLTNPNPQVAHREQPTEQPTQLAHLAGEGEQPEQPEQPKPQLEGAHPPSDAQGEQARTLTPQQVAQVAHPDHAPPARGDQKVGCSPDELPDPW